MKAFSPDSGDVTLPWIMRLRWAALTGQTLMIVICEDFLQIHLPLLPLLALLLFTLGTQLALVRLAGRIVHPSSRLVGGLLLLDTLLLTAMLYFTGGPNNPFSVFYLILIAMAASLLGSGWTWSVLLLSLGCFGAIY